MALTIGILGHGSIGKRHAINATKLGHETLIYDPLTCSPAARTTVMRESDAIVIATPTQRHALDILDCLEHQKPMLIEKPITHPVTATLNLVTDRLAISGVRAFMGFNLRFHECVQKAKEWIPRIGEIDRAYFSVQQKSDRAEYLRDGVISNWMSHEIDLSMHLLGPAVLAECLNASETEATIKLWHSKRGESCIEGDYTRVPEFRKFMIMNKEKAGLVADLVERNVKFFKESRGWDPSGPPIPDETYQAKDCFDVNYVEEMQSWISQIKGGPGKCATWQDGVAVERIVIAAREMGGLQ